MSENDSSAPRSQRDVPDCVTLPVREGFRAGPEPPVEIYLGTEPAQFRATRAFLWSIEQVRDPARVYRVHILSELAGFEKRGWTTGFTNYRYAIPHFAGARGRAIYCDEDQIFLTDPGKLFDLDLHGAGYLAISDTETSVMLIDCERMARIWSLDDARHDRKKAILRRTLKHRGIRGPLDPHWNARDQEYVAGVSHLLHYSTLHTQPWRPFPERFVYRTNRDEKLWLDLERCAVEAGFETFTRENPTSFFRALAERRAPSGSPGETAGSFCPPAVRQLGRELIADLGVESILELDGGSSREAPVTCSAWGGAREARASVLDVATGGVSGGPAEAYDAVIVTGGLAEIPPEDMPWVVERLFRRAGSLVVAVVPSRGPSRPTRGHPPLGTVMTRSWWVAHFEAAAVRHPHVHWQLALAEDADVRGDDFFFRSGGRFPRSGSPTVWVLTDDRPGNTTQSIGLVEQLGWPYERVELDFLPTIYLPNPLVGPSVRVLRADSRRRLVPPWPDLVIAAGRRTAPVTRWIRRKSRGRTKIVQLGRKGANPATAFDLAVVPAHAALCPHPNRIETAAALTRVQKSKLEEAAQQWEYLFEAHPSPRIALLVGGGSHHCSFAPEVAEKLGRDVAKMAEDVRGSVFVTTSRRTTGPATEALRRTLAGAAHFHEWSSEQKLSENPLLGYLALADAIVVTGESESMLAEASESGKPVHIYPLPPRRMGILIRIGAAMVDWIVALAQREPRNNRGTTRPQQGLELFCSRLVAGGFVRPQRDLATVHEAMIRRGRARAFDGSVGAADNAGHSEIEDVADRVRALMGGQSGG